MSDNKTLTAVRTLNLGSRLISNAPIIIRIINIPSLLDMRYKHGTNRKRICFFISIDPQHLFILKSLLESHNDGEDLVSPLTQEKNIYFIKGLRARAAVSRQIYEPQ